MGDQISINNSKITGSVAIGTHATSVNPGNQLIDVPFDKDRFQHLANELTEHGVSQDDISDPHTAVEQDKASAKVAEGKYGPNIASTNKTKWVMVLGAVFGGFTLLFFMALILISMLHRPLPPEDRYLVVIVLSLGSALAASFLGGGAAAKGNLSIPLLKNNPISIGAFGGIAVLIIMMLLGTILYTPISFARENNYEIGLKHRDSFESNLVFQDILKTIEQCGPLYTSWGGTFNHTQINNYITFFEKIGTLYKKGVLTIETIEQTLGSEIILSYNYNEIQKYIEGVRANAGQPEAGEDFYFLGGILSQGNKKLSSLSANCKAIEVGK